MFTLSVLQSPILFKNRLKKLTPQRYKLKCMRINFTQEDLLIIKRYNYYCTNRLDSRTKDKNYYRNFGEAISDWNKFTCRINGNI